MSFATSPLNLIHLGGPAMKVAKSPFDVWIEAEELSRIREVIRAWGTPVDVAEAYGGARLHGHLEQWCQFVETDWEAWDISEYDHDIRCRVWIQLVNRKHWA